MGHIVTQATSTLMYITQSGAGFGTSQECFVLLQVSEQVTKFSRVSTDFFFHFFFVVDNFENVICVGFQVLDRFQKIFLRIFFDIWCLEVCLLIQLSFK